MADRAAAALVFAVRTLVSLAREPDVRSRKRGYVGFSRLLSRLLTITWNPGGGNGVSETKLTTNLQTVLLGREVSDLAESLGRASLENFRSTANCKGMHGRPDKMAV